MKATVLLLFILAAIVCISEARNEIDGQEVVQASEILAKIERGELVNYSQKTIEGDINLSDLKLPKIRINRTMDEIEYHGLSENQTIVESMLFFQDCLIKGDIDFSNVCFLEPVTFWNSSIVGYADFSGAQFDLFGIISSKFNQSVDFSYSQFKEDAYFPYSEFNQSVDYRRSQFNKSVFFNESKFDKQIDFSMSRFNQSIDFSFFILMHQSTLEGLILPNQLTSVTLNSTNLLTSGLILTSQQTLIMFNSREMPILADLNSINQPPLMMLNLTRMSTSVLLNSPEMLISVLLNSTSGPSSIFLILAGMLIFMVPYSMSTLISGNLDSKSPQTL